MFAKIVEGISISLQLTNKLNIMSFSYITGINNNRHYNRCITFRFNDYSIEICVAYYAYLFRERIFLNIRTKKKRWNKETKNDLEKYELYKSLFARLLSCCMCV